MRAASDDLSKHARAAACMCEIVRACHDVDEPPRPRHSLSHYILEYLPACELLVATWEGRRRRAKFATNKMAPRSSDVAAHRLAALGCHLRAVSTAADRSQDWNGLASHLFADPVPERLKDEWDWARTRLDLPALEAAIAALPMSQRKPRVAIVGFALESNNFAPVVGKDDFSR